jgi:hypothetical protein
MPSTLVERVRRGSGRNQQDAARAIGIPRQNFAAYQRGDHTPGERQVLRIVSALGMGEREPNEPAPRYAISYWFLGQCLLSGDGAVVLFSDVYTADAHAARLEDGIGLPAVAIVPLWQSAVDDLSAKHGLKFTPYTGGDATARLVTHLQAAAEAYSQRFQK